MGKHPLEEAAEDAMVALDTQARRIRQLEAEVARLERAIEHKSQLIAELNDEAERRFKEVERLRARLETANDHPLVLVEGGVDGVDRCRRVINKLSHPNFYWNDECLEVGYDSIEEAVQGYEVGVIVPLRPLHELPTVYVCCRHDCVEVIESKAAASAAKRE